MRRLRFAANTLASVYGFNVGDISEIAVLVKEEDVETALALVADAAAGRLEAPN